MEWLVADEEYVTGRGMEELPAGPSLAVMLDCVAMGEEPGIGMDQAALLESMRAGQKMESWATARKLQAIAEFESRLDQEDSDRYEFLFAELSLAMGISKNAAADLAFVADRLVRHLPDTFAAMKYGRISFPQAKIIATATANLDEDLAAAVEARVLQNAHRQTTGQLRAAVKTAIKTVDPEAFTKKLEENMRERRVEVWENQFGTSDLVGRNLPATITDAAFNRLTALAKALKDDGDPRSMDQLRADLFVALLSGQLTLPGGSPASDTPESGSDSECGTDPDQGTSRGHGDTSADQNAGPGHDQWAAGSGVDPDDPGPAEPTEDEVPERESSSWDEGPIEENSPPGPVPAWQGSVPAPADLGDTHAVPTHAQAKAQAEADQARYARENAATVAELAHIEIPELIRSRLDGHSTSSLGRKRLAISEAARIFTARHSGDPGASRTCTLTANFDGTLSHGADVYRPPAAMRRLIDLRDGTCRFPTCRQPASRTDCDHTLAYDAGGPTCPCNLALLCRFHHRTKQSNGWALHHLFPGVLLWTTPTGSWRIVGPAP